MRNQEAAAVVLLLDDELEEDESDEDELDVEPEFEELAEDDEPLVLDEDDRLSVR